MHYVIGDIHGCAYELRELLNKLPLTDDSTVIFLGDYVDRGAYSREVIETIIELSKQCNVVPLMGNHEAMFLEFLKDPESNFAVAFICNGGSSTLYSYGDDQGNYYVPEDHMEFLHNLRLWYEVDDYFFVHAGVPDMPLSDLDPDVHWRHALWLRRPFLDSPHNWGKMIVHGHTPGADVEFKPNRINLDTGCVFNNRLSAMAIPGRRIISVPRQVEDRRVFLRDLGSSRQAVRFRGAAPVQIQIGDRLHNFETLDYSELGMYMRDVDEPQKWVLEIGETIQGAIEPTAESRVTFRGEVVRRKKDQGDLCYALKVWIDYAMRNKATGTDAG